MQSLWGYSPGLELSSNDELKDQEVSLYSCETGSPPVSIKKQNKNKIK